MSRGRPVPPRLIEPHFRWLIDPGFEVVAATDGGITEATYRKGEVLVRATYTDLDEWTDVTIARSRADDLAEEPYWAGVHLDELLHRRRTDATDWRLAPPGTVGMDAARVAFASAAKLLPAVADDLLDGTNLELLDEIIAARPRSGVPGLDYATTERWFASREGIWFATDSELPRSMATYLERSRSEDPADRAVAALKLPIAPRVTNNARDDEAGFARLLELLDDPDPDVRRAAASGLGQWRAIEALGPILALLETETGDRSSPFAAAATFIAFDGSDEQRREVVRALEVFASRGDAAAAQVKELAWRIDGSPKAQYPRSTELWS